MNQMNTPEAILAKVNDFIKTNDKENALIVINDFLNNNKKKTWSSSMETLIKKFIELSVSQNKLKYLKEALNFYRSLSQVTNIDSFSAILSKTKELVEEKFLKALKTFQGVQVEINDLDEDEEEDVLFGYGGEGKEKEELVISQKFIWETYKILLDITKTNSKLFSLYAQILKAAFTFCRENKRTVEFKRLCDSVRNYLQTLIRSEKRQNFLNKVQISHLDVLRLLIQLRLNQIDTATELEQWLESFKTAEDIVYLIDKYEKHSDPKNSKNKKGAKLNPVLKLEFYSNIEKLFWRSNYPLYHAYAIVMVRDIGNKAIIGFGDKAKEKLEKFNLDTVNEKIVLAALCTPLKNMYTNYLKIGEDIYENQNEIETETCKRMMNILKLNHVPSRNSLLSYVINNKLVPQCGEDVQKLFNIFENEKNPINMIKKGSKIIKKLSSSDVKYYTEYILRLKENLITKAMFLFSKSYENISIERINKLFSMLDMNEIEIEDVISEVSRTGLVKCKIDHADKIISFVTLDSKTENFNKSITSFLLSFKRLVEDINKKTNAQKIDKIKEQLFKDIINQRNDGLKTTEDTLKEIKEKSEQLKKYLYEKNNVKFELREKNLNDKEQAKIIQKEKEQLEKEELKNAQKKKEYDIQVKKFVIELLRRYTNSIQIDKKRIKLDDLLKDLSKITEEEIIKCLEQQETDFKLKKEKKLKQVTTNMDYMLREFRKKDNEVYKAQLEKEEKEFNKALQEQSETYYKEKIGMKESLKKFKQFKDNYFEKIKNEKHEKYNNEMKEFKEKLDKQVREDLLKEIKAEFKVYFDDFTQKEKEAESTKQQSSSWSRGSRYNNNNFGERGANFQDNRRHDNKFSNANVEFARGANFNPNDSKPTFERSSRQEQPKTVEFARGANFNPNDQPKFERGAKAEPPKQVEFQRGANFKKEDTKDVTFQRGAKAEPITFQRGAKAEPPKDVSFQRGAKANDTKKDVTFQRGAKAEPKKEITFSRGGNSQTTKKDTGGFNRSGNAKK